jgi:hypothetical protein
VGAALWAGTAVGEAGADEPQAATTAAAAPAKALATKERRLSLGAIDGDSNLENMDVSFPIANSAPRPTTLP